MALTCTHSNHYKYQLAVGALNLLTDSIMVLLMRSGFVFNKDDHATLANLKATSGSLEIAFNDTSKTITRGSGSFITNGFVIGNKITTDSGANPGPFYITDVSALVITCSAASFSNETVTKTITADDELSTAYGYTQNTKVLAGQALAEDDTNDRAELTADNVIWTASGGSIGPTPGAIIMSDTSADKTIMGYIDFGGEQTAPNGAQFTISNEKIRIS